MPVGRRLRFLFVFLTEYLAVGTVPNRHLVSPPQLAGNAPRLNVAHPFEISFLVRLRHKLHFPVFNRANRLFGQRRRVNEPLVGQHRFDHDVGTVAVRDDHRVIFDFSIKPNSSSLAMVALRALWVSMPANGVFSFKVASGFKILISGRL